MGKNISNKTKLYIAFLFFSVLLSSSIVFIENFFYSHSAQKVSLKNAVKKTLERENTLEQFLDEANHVLKSLRNSQCFEKLLKDEKECGDLEVLFYNFTMANKDFHQLRYIDEKGIEKIRVQRSNLGHDPKIIQSKNLQNKSERDYFIKSQSKELEKVWFSAIDLNVEHKKVQIPFKPTLRAILPINKNGKFGGILIINYFMKDFIQKLIHTPLYDMILYDDRGYIISHYDEKKSWSFYKIHPFTLKKEFPQEFERLTTQPLVQTDALVARKFDLDIDGGLHVLLQLKKSFLLLEEERARQKYISIAILVFLFSIGLTFISVKLFGDTLLNLSTIKKLNEKLKKSDLRTNLALKTSEIGIWEWDFHTNKLSWDEQMYKIYGIKKSSNEDLFNLWSSVLLEDHINKIKENFKQAIKEKNEHNVSYWITTPQGVKKYIRAIGVIEYDKEGNPSKMVGTNQDISQLVITEQKYKSLLENAADGVFILNLQGKLIDFSKKAQDMLGYSTEEMKKLSIFDWDLNVSAEKNNELLEQLKSGPFSLESTHTRKDGSSYDAFICANRFELANGEDIIYCTARDISKEKNLEKKLLEERNFANSLLESSSMVILTNGEDSFYANKALLDFFDCTTLEEFQSKIGCIGTQFVSNSHYFSLDMVNDRKWLEALEQLPEEQRIVSMISNQDYEPKVFNITVSKVKDNYLLSFSDISNKMQKQLRLEQKIIHDNLTNAYNREYFSISIDTIIKTNLEKNRHTAVAMIDIDFFKQVNDEYGHDTGDKFLKEFVQTINKNSRDEDILIRWGGEEFLLIMKIISCEDMTKVLEKIRQSIADKGFEDIGHKTCSIGGTLYKEGEDINTTIKRADSALYKAKNSGRNRVEVA